MSRDPIVAAFPDPVAGSRISDQADVEVVVRMSTPTSKGGHHAPQGLSRLGQLTEKDVRCIPSFGPAVTFAEEEPMGDQILWGT